MAVMLWTSSLSPGFAQCRVGRRMLTVAMRIVKASGLFYYSIKKTETVGFSIKAHLIFIYLCYPLAF